MNPYRTIIQSIIVIIFTLVIVGIASTAFFGIKYGPNVVENLTLSNIANSDMPTAAWESVKTKVGSNFSPEIGISFTPISSGNIKSIEGHKWIISSSRFEIYNISDLNIKPITKTFTCVVSKNGDSYEIGSLQISDSPEQSK